MARFANALDRLSLTLRAGEVTLSGSLARFVPCKAGDHPRVTIGDIDSASVCFA